MRIAIASHFFHPSVGGTEEVAQLLADRFTEQGHEVKVITSTRLPNGGVEKACPYEVVRHPGAMELWRVCQWSEVVLHNNISLQMAWPLLLLRRPWVVAHHIWTRRLNGRRGIRDRIKRFAIRFARNIAVSRALAADLPVEARVIGNPYRDSVYFQRDTAERIKPLLFVGRLVPGKGADLLIASLRILEAQGISLALTVVGEGPERERLEELSAGLPVDFVGRKSPEELAQIFREHRILAVPSQCDETFGLVALEGIACGCLVIGSDDGGLPEVIGPCGRIFPRGDAGALAALLAENRDAAAVPLHAEEHLNKYKADEVAGTYLKVLKEAIG